MLPVRPAYRAILPVPWLDPNSAARGRIVARSSATRRLCPGVSSAIVHPSSSAGPVSSQTDKRSPHRVVNRAETRSARSVQPRPPVAVP